MSSTTGLSPRQAKGNRMEENWLWYISGAVDSLANISMAVQKDDRTAIGFNAYPVVRISRPKENQVLFGMLDEYCEENEVKYRIDESDKSHKLIISNLESIERFFDPIFGALIQQQEAVEVLVDEIIPLYKEYEGPTKKEFVKLMRKRDKLREAGIRHSSSKYDTGYFLELWNDEL
jgi:hypothetical protein